MLFEPKDIATTAIGVAALTLSLVNYFQKRGETKQTLRKQLTDALKDLVELNLKATTFKSVDKKDGYPKNYLSLIGDQRRFLVRQAASLSDTLGNLVNTHEKIIIASTFASMDYVEDAERLFESAVATSAVGVDRGLALRNYGRFLYEQLEFEEAESKYAEAIIAFRGDDDRSRFYRCATFRQWAEQEYFVRQPSGHVEKYIDMAKHEAQGFKTEGRKRAELVRIEESLKGMVK